MNADIGKTHDYRINNTPNVTGSDKLDYGIQYGGFWRRLAAFCIDYCIISILMAIALLILLLLVFVISNDASTLYNLDLENTDINDVSPRAAVFIVILMSVFYIIAIAGNWLYYALMSSSKFMGTLGYMAMGIVVTDEKCQRLSFARATGRHFASYISGPLTIYIGYIMIAFNSKKQGLHDIIANTFVIKKNTLIKRAVSVF